MYAIKNKDDFCAQSPTYKDYLRVNILLIAGVWTELFCDGLAFQSFFLGWFLQSIYRMGKNLHASRLSAKIEKISIKSEKPMRHHNPVVYFEIPVLDIERAMNFYSKVFNITFTKTVIDGYEMALFPYNDTQFGASGALAKGEVYKPSKEGIFVYFGVDSIDKTLELAIQNGGQVLYPKKSNGELGFVAEFEDSEGNRIALHEALK